MRSGFTRREVLAGSLGLVAVGCTGQSERALPEVDEAPATALPPPTSAARPLTTIPGPELVLLANGGSPVVGSSSVISVYSDGRVLRERSPAMFDEPEPGPLLVLTEIAAARLASLTALVARQDFADAAPHYAQPGMHDGGATIYVGGAGQRRIVVVNQPPGLPAALSELGAELDNLEQLLDRIGVDAFKARGGLLLAHKRNYHSRSHADQLTVFADGTLDHRVLHGTLTVEPESDFPYPIVTLRRIDPDVLRPLIAALQALRAAPPTQPRSTTPAHRRRRGTVHTLAMREQSLRWDLEAAPPPALERVLLESTLLRSLFDAPPDEPTEP